MQTEERSPQGISLLKMAMVSRRGEGNGRTNLLGRGDPKILLRKTVLPKSNGREQMRIFVRHTFSSLAALFLTECSSIEPGCQKNPSYRARNPHNTLYGSRLRDARHGIVKRSSWTKGWGFFSTSCRAS